MGLQSNAPLALPERNRRYPLGNGIYIQRSLPAQSSVLLGMRLQRTVEFIRHQAPSLQSREFLFRKGDLRLDSEFTRPKTRRKEVKSPS